MVEFCQVRDDNKFFVGSKKINAAKTKVMSDADLCNNSKIKVVEKYVYLVQ